VLADEVGEGNQKVSAVSGREVAPGGVFEGFAGGFDGGVDICRGGGVDGGYFSFITEEIRVCRGWRGWSLRGID